jgi:hypothetical protein
VTDDLFFHLGRASDALQSVQRLLPPPGTNPAKSPLLDASAAVDAVRDVIRSHRGTTGGADCPVQGDPADGTDLGGLPARHRRPDRNARTASTTRCCGPPRSGGHCRPGLGQAPEDGGQAGSAPTPTTAGADAATTEDSLALPVRNRSRQEAVPAAPTRNDMGPRPHCLFRPGAVSRSADAWRRSRVRVLQRLVAEQRPSMRGSHDCRIPATYGRQIWMYAAL